MEDRRPGNKITLLVSTFMKKSSDSKLLTENRMVPIIYLFFFQICVRQSQDPRSRGKTFARFGIRREMKKTNFIFSLKILAL
jgi:hypothetical protein